MNNPSQIRDIDIKILRFNNIKKLSVKESSQYYMSLYFKFIKLLELYEEGELNINHYEYLELAQNLFTFSKVDTSWIFKGVDEERNLVYIAVIYYILGYKYECNIILDLFDKNYIENKFINIIIGLIRNRYYDCEIIEYVKKYYLGEDKSLDKAINILYEMESECNFKDQTYIQIIISILLNIQNNGFYVNMKKNSELDISIWKEYIQYNITENQVLYELPKYHYDLIKNGILSFDNKCINMPTNYSKLEIIKIIIYSYLNINKTNKILYIYSFKNKTNIRRMAHYFFKYKSQIKFEDLDFIIGTEDILNRYDFIIIDDFDNVSSKQYGVQYEMILSMILKLQKKLLVINNSYLDMKFKEFSNINYDKGCNKYDNLVGYYFIDNKNKEMEIEYKDTTITCENYLLSKKINDEIKLKGVSHTSSLNRSLISAINLISKGYKVSIFISQKNSSKSGIIKISEKLLNLINDTKISEVYSSSNIRDDLLERAKLLLGKNSIYFKLLIYGVIVIHSDMPQEIIEYMRYIVNIGKHKIIIGDKILSENFSKYTEVMIIDSIRINLDKEWIEIDDKTLASLLDDFADDINKKYIILSNYKQKKIYKEKYSNVMDGLALNSYISQSLYNIALFNLDYKKEINNILNNIEYNICEYILYNYTDSYMRNLLYTNNIIKEPYFDTLIKDRFTQQLDNRINKLNNLSKDELIIIYKSKSNKFYLDIYNNLKNKDYDLKDKDLIKYIFYNYIVKYDAYINLIEKIEYIYKYSIDQNMIFKLIIQWIEGKSYEEMLKSTEIEYIDIIFLIIEKLIKTTYIDLLEKVMNISRVNENTSLYIELGSIKTKLLYGVNENIILDIINYTLVDRDLIKKMNLFVIDNQYLLQLNIKTILLTIKESLQLDDFEKITIDKLIHSVK